MMLQQGCRDVAVVLFRYCNNFVSILHGFLSSDVAMGILFPHLNVLMTFRICSLDVTNIDFYVADVFS